jgi:hypothetical protein
MQRYHIVDSNGLVVPGCKPFSTITAITAIKDALEKQNPGEKFRVIPVISQFEYINNQSILRL